LATKKRKQSASSATTTHSPTSDKPASTAATSASDRAVAVPTDARYGATEFSPQPAGGTAGEQVANMLKLVADVALTPGSGQLVEGKVGEGVLYGLAGVAAKIISPALGPLCWVPWVTVALDSFSMSAAGKHLWQR